MYSVLCLPQLIFIKFDIKKKITDTGNKEKYHKSSRPLAGTKTQFSQD